MRQIEYHDMYGRHEINLQYFPDLCNHCNTSTAFIIRECWFNHDTERFNYLLECTHCHNCSIYISDTNHKLISMLPQKTITDHLPTNIATLSPSFCEIYKQCQLAENAKLFEICGMGYRKALEFLIKDYVISIFPNEKQIVESETLISTVRRINSNQIKTLAERIAWLGNDQTHYIKKHTDRDLSDLKIFLETVIKYIDMELTYHEATKITKQ